MPSTFETMLLQNAITSKLYTVTWILCKLQQQQWILLVKVLLQVNILAPDARIYGAMVLSRLDSSSSF